MAAYAISERVRVLDKVDFEDAKHTTHFEWVIEFEKTIKELGVEVFETLGVNDENALQIALNHLEKFQDNLKTKMDDLVKQIADKADVNDSAKTFVAEWVEACKYQISCKYHLIDGPTDQKVRRGFESPIKHIVICSSHLSTLDDDIEYKKFVSDYIKNVVIQSLIDELKNVKRELETINYSS